MIRKRKLPTPFTILMIVIVIAAIATWILPAGKYDRLEYVEETGFIVHSKDGDKPLAATQQTLDSLEIRIALEKFKTGKIRKPVSIPNTYHRIESNRQGFFAILQAPLKGILDSIEVILFVLVIGGFMNVFNETGAMVKGLTRLSCNMKGKESWLIIILTFLFSVGGSTFGMAEEGLVFYPVLVPLFLAAGYDLIVPVAVIFGGTQLGTLSSITNPFSTIIASDAAGVSWREGFEERIVMFVVSSAITIWYIVRYANKVKKDPTASLVYKIDGEIKNPFPSVTAASADTRLDLKTKMLLLLFLGTFLTMIAGVVWMDWWLTEMSTLFLGASILIAVILRMKESLLVERFLKGAGTLLPVAFIIGIARGVTIILNEGNISDTILYNSAKMVSSMQPAFFIVILLVLFMLFTLFISSSSGMAVLTMPVMGALAIIAGVPGQEIVNAYLYGMGIMGFMTPTGLILPSLTMVNVSLKAWWKFIAPLLIILFLVCAAFLVVGIYLK
jgi:uncharacterized ion transporter superfamily protein YfcC